MKLRIQLNGQIYQFYTKLEFMNPSGSVKDRIAKYMIESAEKRRHLKTRLNNRGSNQRQHRDSACDGRRGQGIQNGRLYARTHEQGKNPINRESGTSVCLTPKAEGFEGTVRRTEEIAKRIHNVYLTKQFSNEENVTAHYEATGQEIVRRSARK